MGERFLQNKELKDKLLEGVNLVGDIVGSTLGPHGRFVLIDDNGHPYVTKDGVTVAKSISHEDRVINSAVELIKQTADKTVRDAGDGTSTSVVLAKALIANSFNTISENNPSIIEFIKGIDFAAKIISEKIVDMAKKVETVDDVENIARISANGDTSISSLIKEAASKVGIDGTIHVVKNSTGKTYLDVTPGFKFAKGPVVPNLISKEGKDILDDVYVVIYNGDLNLMEPVLGTLQDIAETGKHNVLLLAHSFGGSVIDNCILNKNGGILNIYPVEAPSFGVNRNSILEDICVLTSDVSDLPSTITEPIIGRCGKVILTRDTTTLFDGFGNDTNVAIRIEKLEGEKKECDDVLALQVIKERLSNLRANVATLYIGGLTEADINERADRIDDAVCAVRSAVEEGIVLGGGKTYMICFDHLDTVVFNGLYDISSDFYLGYKVVQDSLFAPFETLMSNSAFEGSYACELYEGIDFRNNEIVNLWESGIVDPAKASRVAFENAVAITKIILNINSYIAA